MKLIYYHLNSNFELFNINKDIGEFKNLVSSERDKLKELSKELGNYLRKVNAQMPVQTSTNTLVPWPDDKKILNVY